VMAGSATSGQKLQVVIASYQISTTLMGDSVLEENIIVTNMSYLPRRTITYPDTEGYAPNYQIYPRVVGVMSLSNSTASTRATIMIS